MRLTPDDFKDGMPDDVYRAVQHYRATGEIAWTPPPGTPDPATPACAACQDVGSLAVREPGQSVRYVACPHCEIAVRRLLAKIQPDFLEATFARGGQVPMAPDAALVWRLTQQWAASGSGSILLLGEFGALKTTLATAAWRYRVEERLAASAEWVVVPDFLEDIRRSYDPSGGLALSLAFERARTTELLLFDDLGAERVNERNQDWVQEQLYRLLNWRSNQRLATIFTTNLSLAQLEQRLGRAIASRIEGMCGDQIWVLDPGVDFRRVPR